MKLVDMLYGFIEPAIREYDIKKFGKEIQFKLNDDMVMSICFNDSHVRDHYDQIVMKVVGRCGEVNLVRLDFVDVFAEIRDMNHPNYIHKYLDYDGASGSCRWYGKPNDNDIRDIRKAVSDYIGMWK